MFCSRVPILAAAVTVALQTSPPRIADAEAGVLKVLSQRFSDASASGDVATLGRLLDDRVVFVNKDGTFARKSDLIAPQGPQPAGRSTKLVQSDFVVTFHGRVGVTSFTDNATTHFHGQTILAAFRSTEVWLHERDGWKMISSQTIALSIDPPATTLPAAALETYVGTYTAGPGYSVKISRANDHLMTATNGGHVSPLLAEIRDVFFVPGQPRGRRIFKRDAHGAVVGFVSRREGHGIMLRRIS